MHEHEMRQQEQNPQQRQPRAHKMKNSQQIQMILVNIPLVSWQRNHRRYRGYGRSFVHCKTFRNSRPNRNTIAPSIVPKNIPTINPMYQLFARTREVIIGNPFIRS